MEYITAGDLVRMHDITIEEVKAVPVFSGFSNEEAQEVVDTFKLLANIILKYHEKSEANTLKNG
uniref:hypothetical protein n=1 Tax=Pedobacter schmidteae TaxID=2201271 RepID=UPI000EB34566|nr:hypothetical protein [Pedobacter schmidteae]